MFVARSTFLLGVCLIVVAPRAGVRAQGPSTFESRAKPFLQSYCLDCHGSDTQEGDVAFHDLADVDPDNAELWKSVWEQVALKEMPPKDESQPAALERLHFSNWITGRLRQATRDKGGFDAHMRPSKGNHLDQLLFGTTPEGLEPASTPARIWPRRAMQSRPARKRSCWPAALTARWSA